MRFPSTRLADHELFRDSDIADTGEIVHYALLAGSIMYDTMCSRLNVVHDIRVVRRSMINPQNDHSEVLSLVGDAITVKPDDPLGCRAFPVGSSECLQCRDEISKEACFEDSMRRRGALLQFNIPKFNIPNLRVGTLDSLLSLSDDLTKITCQSAETLFYSDLAFRFPQLLHLISSLTSQVSEMKAMMTLLLQNHQGSLPSQLAVFQRSSVSDQGSVPNNGSFMISPSTFLHSNLNILLNKDIDIRNLPNSTSLVVSCAEYDKDSMNWRNVVKKIQSLGPGFKVEKCQIGIHMRRIRQHRRSNPWISGGFEKTPAISDGSRRPPLFPAVLVDPRYFRRTQKTPAISGGLKRLPVLT
ncbi:hypothetical protein V8G54_003355 [Vigna mungo]|uniref:V-type proton ATPase subunit C n=1 Tax=Vigna mungo TaxID=3915 RepID=A0AAQ3SDQ4_VIGMU